MKRYALLASIAAIGGTIAFQGSVNLQPTTLEMKSEIAELRFGFGEQALGLQPARPILCYSS